jgi:hypothetical protein
MKHGTGLLIALTCVATSFAVQAADPDPVAVQTEIKYAEALRELGLHRFADQVIVRIPDQKNRAVIFAQFQAFMHQHHKNPEKVDAYIRDHSGDDPETYWIMKIRFADALWAWGMQQESKATYQEFMDFYGQWLDKSKQE